MGEFPFRPAADDVDRIGRDVAAIPDIQAVLQANDPAHLKARDRVAHQYQIAGGKVVLRIASGLPGSLGGIGLFEPDAEYVGIGRVSTGEGCPHAETEPDFLGMRLAFQTRDGVRVDFLGINDPSSPTDTHAEFVKLLAAGAAGAGHGFFASEVRVLSSLTHSLGPVRGSVIAAHATAQTVRAATSATAYQTYWTGIVEIAGAPGKFVIDPVSQENHLRSLTSSARHLTDDWNGRQAHGALAFDLFWIPFIDEHATSLTELMRAWKEQRALIGRVTFPQCDHTSEDARRWAALANEMGANAGNWVADRANTIAQPATEFGVARKIAYRQSQDGRNALPEARYADVFRTGTIGAELAQELDRRRALKRDLGHVDSAPSQDSTA